MILLDVFDFQCVIKKIYNSNGHHCYCTGLPYSIGGQTHGERENGSSEQTHDHEAGNFILFIGCVNESLRENNGEYI